jgi:ATP synthase protein I
MTTGGPGADGQNAGWTIFSYLIAGMVCYGGLGWLIGHWTGHPVIFPLGMLLGLAVSIGLVIHRYGRG